MAAIAALWVMTTVDPVAPMKSTHVRAAQAQERWLLYDASEHNLGRMATQIATHLMGKDRPTYTPSELTGAHVVVINAAKARLTGTKGETKTYSHYTRYSGGYKTVGIDRMRVQRSEDIIALAVRRMLPKSRLGHDMLRRLKVYPSTDHPHGAQKPVKVEPKVQRTRAAASK
jgi:large subunit ribosomal protein L13